MQLISKSSASKTTRQIDKKFVVTESPHKGKSTEQFKRTNIQQQLNVSLYYRHGWLGDLILPVSVIHP